MLTAFALPSFRNCYCKIQASIYSAFFLSSNAKETKFIEKETNLKEKRNENFMK
jgi:hypothetical protein